MLFEQKRDGLFPKRRRLAYFTPRRKLISSLEDFEDFSKTNAAKKPSHFSRFTSFTGSLVFAHDI